MLPIKAYPSDQIGIRQRHRIRTLGRLVPQCRAQRGSCHPELKPARLAIRIRRYPPALQQQVTTGKQRDERCQYSSQKIFHAFPRNDLLRSEYQLNALRQTHPHDAPLLYSRERAVQEHRAALLQFVRFTPVNAKECPSTPTLEC